MWGVSGERSLDQKPHGQSLFLFFGLQQKLVVSKYPLEPPGA